MHQEEFVGLHIVFLHIRCMHGCGFRMIVTGMKKEKENEREIVDKWQRKIVVLFFLLFWPSSSLSLGLNSAALPLLPCLYPLVPFSI